MDLLLSPKCAPCALSPPARMNQPGSWFRGTLEPQEGAVICFCDTQANDRHSVGAGASALVLTSEVGHREGCLLNTDVGLPMQGKSSSVREALGGGVSVMDSLEFWL